MRLMIVFILLSFNCCSQQGILGINASNLPANPTLLTWTKVHEERFLSLIDENHVKYESDFASSTSDLSAISGSAPGISGGNLVITNSCKYQSTSTTVAAWASAELTISSMGSAGDSNKLGPMFIKDATHYIAVVYDKVRGYLQIIQNDVRLSELPYTINTTNCKIFLIVAGNSISVWYQESGDTEPTVGFTQNSTDDLKALDISEYKFGVYCLQSGGTTTHNVSSLRGSAAGGCGLFNNKIVRNTDGSDYILAGKLLMTADLVNVSNATYQWNDANSVLLSIDTATFDVEIVGRFYFDRSLKRLGGQDLHIIWDGSNWLINYVPADRIGLAESSDYYFYLPYADIFTEVVVDEADLTVLNAGTGIGYDVSTRIIGGVFKLATTNLFNACLYSGSDLDAVSNVACYDDAEDWECAQWIHFGGSWYLTYSSYGDTRQIVLNYPAMTLVGYMDLPFVSDPEGRIPGYDWYCKQTNGRTTYYMIGFDTEEFEATIPVYGLTKFPWTMGNLVVWKATETRHGNEF